MSQSDIVIGKDGSRGRLIKAECHIVAKVPGVDAINSQERMLARMFPDWEEKIMYFVGNALGPTLEPDRLHHINPRELVKLTLLWVISEQSKMS
jgi:hypothetical protein